MRATSGRPYSVNYLLGQTGLIHVGDTLDPDADYWSERAIALKDGIEIKIGFPAFHAVVDRIFPGETIQEKTWKEIRDAWERVYRAIKGGITDPERLVYYGLDMPEPECSCVLPEQSCPVCRESARKVWSDAES